MKFIKVLLLLTITSVCLSFSNAQESSFKDLFENVNLKEGQKSMNTENKDNNIDTENDNNDDDKGNKHQSASDLDIPKPELSIIKENGNRYLDINWNIDKQKYNPLVLISRDGKNFYSSLFENRIKLNGPGKYDVRFQVQPGNSYVTFHEESIVNDYVEEKKIGKPDTGPYLYGFFIGIFIISLLIYLFYIRLRF